METARAHISSGQLKGNWLPHHKSRWTNHRWVASRLEAGKKAIETLWSTFALIAQHTITRAPKLTCLLTQSSSIVCWHSIHMFGRLINKLGPIILMGAVAKPPRPMSKKKFACVNWDKHVYSPIITRWLQALNWFQFHTSDDNFIIASHDALSEVAVSGFNVIFQSSSYDNLIYRNEVTNRGVKSRLECLLSRECHVPNMQPTNRSVQAMWDVLATRYFSFRFEHKSQNFKTKIWTWKTGSGLGNIWSSAIGKSIVKFLLPWNLRPASEMIMKIRLRRRPWNERRADSSTVHILFMFFVCGHVVRPRFLTTLITTGSILHKQRF